MNASLQKTKTLERFCCLLYVIPRMSIPILLSEDYQTAYELSVFRNVESGSCIRFSNTSFNISATGVDQSDNAAKLRKSTVSTEGFLKAKTHRRDKVHCHHRKQALLAAAQCIRAAHDAHIPAHTVKPIKVEGNFADECEWLIEKILLSGSKDKFFCCPQFPDIVV